MPTSGDDDEDLVAVLMRTNRPARGGFDFVGIGDAGAAEFLDQKTHGVAPRSEIVLSATHLFSFPRSAWERIFGPLRGHSSGLKRRRASRGPVPTQSVGMRGGAALGRLFHIPPLQKRIHQ